MFQKMKVGQNGAPETPGAKAKGKLDYFNATMGKLHRHKSSGRW